MAKRLAFENIVYEINTLIKHSELYPEYSPHILAGKKLFGLSQTFTKKNYTTDWIHPIEECITALDTIVRNPRRFIAIEEDVLDISLAKSISVESVKHLAQHTNFISSVKENGEVVPSKILNTSKEESFEIYENRFIYTLLLKMADFIGQRYEVMKTALLQSGDISVNVDGEFQINEQKMAYKLEGTANIPFDAITSGRNKGRVSDLERVLRIKNITSDFLSSAFAREMRNSALVRPPIQRTNVILKDQNFKKALILWQFITTNENMQFKLDADKETIDMPPPVADKYVSLVYLNSLILQSIAESHAFGEAFEEEERDKEKADEFESKNIDDFVPDDFPELKMDLTEVRRIYYKIPGDRSLNLAEIAKMNAALDRVLRQDAINKAKEDSLAQKRLIEKQNREIEEAKRIALREAQEKEKARLRAEKEALELEKKLEREKLAAEARAETERQKAEKERLLAEARAEKERKLQEKERLAELARLAREKKAEEKRREEERKEAVRQAAEARANKEKKIREEAAGLEAERIAENQRKVEEEKKRLAEIQRLRLEEDAFKEKLLSQERLLDAAREAAARVDKERAEHWARQRETAFRLLAENFEGDYGEAQKKMLRSLMGMELARREVLKSMEHLLSNAAAAESMEAIEKLYKEAESFRGVEEVEKIKGNLENGADFSFFLNIGRLLETAGAVSSSKKKKKTIVEKVKERRLKKKIKNAKKRSEK